MIKTALSTFIFFTLFLGLAYPGVITVIGQGLFPKQALGSLISKEKAPIGSLLIGQMFTDPAYFWPRPSATSPPYNPALSSGSNLGPTNPQLLIQVQKEIELLKASDPSKGSPLPIDLVTSSGSGLDPHISPLAAYYQAPRVAEARKKDLSEILALIDDVTEKRQWKFLGEPRVNVLKLNLKLDHE